MSLKPLSLAAIAFVALTGMAGAASATTMAECSTKYQTAKTAGTLNGMTWNDFRKSQCASSTDTTAAATTTAPAAATTTATTKKKAKAAATTTTAAATATDTGSEPTADNTVNAVEPAAPTMKAPKNVVFPRAVAALYANETPAKQRMHTCLDQYRTDKANNALGGLVWIQKGGGYYSICNAKLKG